MRARKRSAALDCFEQIRRAGVGVGMTHAVAYLYVCENEGLNIAELAIVLRTTRPTASRTAHALLAESDPGAREPYLGLLKVNPNPNDARGRTLCLSERGLALRDELNRTIAEAQPITNARNNG